MIISNLEVQKIAKTTKVHIKSLLKMLLDSGNMIRFITNILT